MTTRIAHLSPTQLLALHARIAEELRVRGIIRSSNNPTGDLAEHLFCKAFKWRQTENANAHIDAIDRRGVRFQIKGRRITPQNPSRELGALRDLENGHFDFLAAVLFFPDYTVMRAAIIPHAVALERAAFVTRTNAHKFLLRDDVWAAMGVRDVTSKLRAVTL